MDYDELVQKTLPRKSAIWNFFSRKKSLLWNTAKKWKQGIWRSTMNRPDNGCLITKSETYMNNYGCNK